MLTAFVVKTPVENLSNSNQTLQTVNAVNVSEDGKSISVQQGLIGIDNSTSIDLDDNTTSNIPNPFVDPTNIWRQAVKNSCYINSLNFDYGYQLLNLFVLNKVTSNTSQLLATMAYLNQGADLKFSSFNTNVDSDQSSDI